MIPPPIATAKAIGPSGRALGGGIPSPAGPGGADRGFRVRHGTRRRQSGGTSEAKRRGIPIIGFINSWDKVTGRCIIRLLPDKLIVFNDIVKKEAMEHDEVKEENIFVAGITQYDHYFKQGISSKENFYRKIGIDISKKIIVYAPAGRAFSDSDWDIIDFLRSAISAGKLGNTELDQLIII